MSKNKTKEQDKTEAQKRKDLMIESQRWEEVEWVCPERGKIKQKVLVTRYKPSKDTSLDIVKTGNPLIDESPIAELVDDDMEITE